MTHLDSILKSRDHCFADKGPSSQSRGFSRSHAWMWELDHIEGWALQNWCFWTVVLEKTPESPLDCKEIQPVHPKGNQSWIFIGRTDADAETPILWPPDANNWLIRKDLDVGKYWMQEKKGRTEGEMVGWHHHLIGYEVEQVPGDGEGLGSLLCCKSMGSQRVRHDWATEKLLNVKIEDSDSQTQNKLVVTSWEREGGMGKRGIGE